MNMVDKTSVHIISAWTLNSLDVDSRDHVNILKWCDSKILFHKRTEMSCSFLWSTVRVRHPPTKKKSSLKLVNLTPNRTYPIKFALSVCFSVVLPTESWWLSRPPFSWRMLRSSPRVGEHLSSLHPTTALSRDLFSLRHLERISIMVSQTLRGFKAFLCTLKMRILIFGCISFYFISTYSSPSL